MKYCKNLIVAYYPQPDMMVFGIYSSGTKRLGCTQKRLCSRSSDNLVDLKSKFIRNNCLSCVFKESRDENFKLNKKKP